MADDLEEEDIQTLYSSLFDILRMFLDPDTMDVSNLLKKIIWNNTFLMGLFMFFPCLIFVLIIIVPLGSAKRACAANVLSTHLGAALGPSPEGGLPRRSCQRSSCLSMCLSL